MKNKILLVRKSSFSTDIRIVANPLIEERIKCMWYEIRYIMNHQQKNNVQHEYSPSIIRSVYEKKIFYDHLGTRIKMMLFCIVTIGPWTCCWRGLGGYSCPAQRRNSCQFVLQNHLFCEGCNLPSDSGCYHH